MSDKFNTEVKKLELEEGDLLIVRYENGSTGELRALRKMIQDVINSYNIKALIIDKNIEISKLSDEQLRQVGLMRMRIS